MAKKPEELAQRPTFSDDDIRKARVWFQKGQEMASKRNFEYAIESYLQGLNFWPDAVDEGHNPAYAAALFCGQRKVGFGEKHKSSKDPKQAMLGAENLLCKEPQNVAHMEAMFRHAAKGRFDLAAMWVGTKLSEAAQKAAKPNPAHFELLAEVFEQLGDANEKGDPRLGIQFFEQAVEALNKLRIVKPSDLTISMRLRDVAGKLTILKGQYSSAESFRDSVRDTDAQKEIQDRERLVQSDERLEAIIARAKATYEANPKERKALMDLADLLCRREDEQEENKAISLLVKAYKETNEYSYRLRAEDIRIRQLGRKGRELAAAGDKAALDHHRKEQLKFEIKVYKDRIAQYPTDMRLRFHYGERLFKAGQYDEAIPVLQEARNDPKSRFKCSLFIGRCFYKKGFHSGAIDQLKEAIATYEIPDDDTGKELNYWLGRTYEADGQTPEALKTYGQLIQWDYNYRDVRKRIDDLKGRP